MTLADLIPRVLWSPPTPRPVRFDDLVWAVRVQIPDADVCEIDKAARPYERGNPGAYTYEPLQIPFSLDGAVAPTEPRRRVTRGEQIPLSLPGWP